MCNHGDETHVEQRPSAAGVMVTVLTHGLVVEQRHPVDTTRYCGWSPEFLAETNTQQEVCDGQQEVSGLFVFSRTSYFLYIPILMSDAMTEPSTSPKKRPTWWIKRQNTIHT